jgi:5-methyltetrahydrofolate--homocysteine methyltransferase
MLKTSTGIPGTADERIELAAGAASMAESAGVDPGRIFFDPVFQPIATSGDTLTTVLDTLDGLEKHLGGYGTVGGLSNVSFGLPMRRLVNRTFLAILVSKGIKAVICDPTDRDLVDTLLASEAAMGMDSGCRRYLKAYRERA